MKSIWDEVVCIHRICVTLFFIRAAILCIFLRSLSRLILTGSALIRLSNLVLINMCSEWFLIFVRQSFEISAILEEFNDCLFDVCECKEFFYAHFLWFDCLELNLNVLWSMVRDLGSTKLKLEQYGGKLVTMSIKYQILSLLKS